MLTNDEVLWAKYQGVNFRNYGEIPVFNYFESLYSIVWIEHYGTANINFESCTLNGHYLIFLCPEEIFEVRGFKALKLITISTAWEITEDSNFVCAFSKMEKCVELKGAKLSKAASLFNDLQKIIYNKYGNNTYKLLKTLFGILGISPNCNGKSDSNIPCLACNFVGLVQKHYKMFHEMSFYARNLHTSPKKICETFHFLQLLTPHKFIKKRILAEAKRQLLYTNKTSKTIGYDVGFNDPAYFSRFFKKNTGLTTRGFRLSYNINP